MIGCPTFAEKYVYSFPERGCRAALVIWSAGARGVRHVSMPYLARLYALPYQPMSFKEWKLLVIRGIACIPPISQGEIERMEVVIP